MPQTVEGQYKNLTSTDLELASAYYPLLVDAARESRRLTYRELVDAAKQACPDREMVQSAIAVSTGRRLDVVRLFTAERALPDLASLVTSKADAAAPADLDKVFAFDWSATSADFDGFARQVEAATKPRKKIKEAVALTMMSSHYLAHRDALPAKIRDRRESIIKRIMEGYTAEEAFDYVQAQMRTATA